LQFSTHIFLNTPCLHSNSKRKHIGLFFCHFSIINFNTSLYFFIFESQTITNTNFHKQKITMKKLTLLFTISLAAFCATAQNVAINNDGTTATGSAMLDVKSTTKGFMMPRMTSAQRSAIQNPVLGLLVFDTDTKTIWSFNGSSWTNLTAAGAGGSLTLPFTQTINLPGAAFRITNTSTAIQGSSSNVSTAAINGSSNNTGGMGVFGSSSAGTGIGVAGSSPTGTGVFGLSTDGVGVKAISTNGLALQVSGKVRIAGGNTNPTQGAVLTSDASGNAVWKSNRIAFSVSGVNYNLSNLSNFPANTRSTVHLTTKEFDYGINYSINTDGSPTFGEDMFVAPKTGLYHFNAALGLADDQAEGIEGVWLKIKIIRVVNGSAAIIYGATSEFLKVARADWLAQATISKDIKLVAGDIVSLELDNTGSNPSTVRINNSGGISHFGCHLLFED
jgi:hypothetical protein